MKHIHTYSNIGDSLSSINFNFTCLDIKLCNLQTEANNKWNKIRISNEWSSSFLESLAMSANWQDVKQQVHNASAYWDTRICSIFYPDPFPEGQVSVATLQSWINTNYPPANYRNGQIFIIYFFEWYKTPSLHTPPSNSVSKFGPISEENNVHVKRVGHITFEKKVGKWFSSQQLHFNKPCPPPCDPCWGRLYYPDHPLCLPDPVYYQLSCAGPDEEVVVVKEPCDFLEDDISWNFIPIKSVLLNDVVFQNLSASKFSPYRLDVKESFNPELDYLGNGVYTKYINESPKPTVDNSTVERISGFFIQYNYDYDSNANNFTNEAIFSSDSSYFGASSVMSFPQNFTTKELKKYLVDNSVGELLNEETSACPFRIQVDTVWYRWVTNNLSVSSSPYWHIGVEPGSAFGFYHNPLAGVPDPAANWNSAYSISGNALSAYFGTYIDMSGKIEDVKVFALSS